MMFSRRITGADSHFLAFAFELKRRFRFGKFKCFGSLRDRQCLRDVP